MKYEVEKLAKSQVKVSVAYTIEEFKPYLEGVHEASKSNVTIPGFRKGMAPESLTNQALNPHAIFESALEDAVRDSLKQVSEEKDWTIIDKPAVELKEDTKNISFEMTLTLFPEVELPDYRALARKNQIALEENLKKVALAEGEVDKTVDWLRNSRAKIVLVDRAAKNEDVVQVSIKTMDEGKPVSGGNLSKEKFILGKGRFLAGLEEQLVGKLADHETRKSRLNTGEDYWQENLRNRKLDLGIVLEAVYERELPELTDEFVKTLGKFENIADLKKNLEEGILAEKKMKEEEKFKAKTIEDIVAQSKIEVPDIMLNRFFDELHASNQIHDHSEESHNKLKIESEKRVKGHLVISKISEVENLNPTEAELDEAITHHETEKGTFKTEGEFYDYIYGIIQNQKVFSFLFNKPETEIKS
mgnify:CR=1 FL=1